MNILFLSLLDISSIYEQNLYTDLLNVFIKHKHRIYIVSPTERRNSRKTHVIEEKNNKILKVKTGNITKANIVEKGISTLLIEQQFISAIKKNYKKIKFDLVMYATPPITFYKTVKYMKEEHTAITYLLLKDIFPQNAVDLGMMSKKSPIYKYFRQKEKKLYQISDHIGCMSQANVDYLLKHNTNLETKAHILPNSIEPEGVATDAELKAAARMKYGIPKEARVYLYGGNLGKPQDIPFIIECLKQNQDKDDRYFVICGTGTEYCKLENYVSEYNPTNIKLINGLPKADYEELLSACDVGLIFLDHRFTIPNFPSRLLDYMEKAMPVIACTDTNTDVGKVITDGSFGWWCESNNPDNFTDIINSINNDDIPIKGSNARKYLEDNYTSEKSYDIIIAEGDYYISACALSEGTR